MLFTYSVSLFLCSRIILGHGIVNIRYRPLGGCAPQAPPNHNFFGETFVRYKTLRDGHTTNRGLIGESPRLIGESCESRSDRHYFEDPSLLPRGGMILARGAGTEAKKWHVAMTQFLKLVLFLFRLVTRKIETAARGLLIPLLILFSNVHSTANRVRNNTNGVFVIWPLLCRALSPNQCVKPLRHHFYSPCQGKCWRVQSSALRNPVAEYLSTARLCSFPARNKPRSTIAICFGQHISEFCAWRYGTSPQTASTLISGLFDPPPGTLAISRMTCRRFMDSAAVHRCPNTNTTIPLMPLACNWTWKRRFAWGCGVFRFAAPRKILRSHFCNFSNLYVALWPNG